MQYLEFAPLEKSETWLYARTVPCEVRIVRHHTLYGSGDYEDPPDIAEDKDVQCFYLLLRTPEGIPEWVTGGVAQSLAAAVLLAEEKLGQSLVWRE